VCVTLVAFYLLIKYKYALRSAYVCITIYEISSLHLTLDFNYIRFRWVFSVVIKSFYYIYSLKKYVTLKKKIQLFFSKGNIIVRIKKK
jgi:hypothetical protein